jgi:hypothetical protein
MTVQKFRLYPTSLARMCAKVISLLKYKVNKICDDDMYVMCL